MTTVAAQCSVTEVETQEVCERRRLYEGSTVATIEITEFPPPLLQLVGAEPTPGNDRRRSDTGQP